MKVELFVLCDAATDYAGKLNILGTYDTIVGASLPIQSPLLVFATRIRFRSEEQGTKTCELKVIDYDGRMTLPPFKVQLELRLPADRDSAAINFILNINGALFKATGTHRIDLCMDTQVVASLPLAVQLRT